MIDLNAKIEAIERRNQERRRIDDERRSAEIEALTLQQQQIELFLDNIKDKS